MHSDTWQAVFICLVSINLVPSSVVRYRIKQGTCKELGLRRRLVIRDKRGYNCVPHVLYLL